MGARDPTTVSGGISGSRSSALTVISSSAAAPAKASAPPLATIDHDRAGIGGRPAPACRAASTASVAMRTACPSSRLIATATTSANAVQAGALQPKPALALRHHSVR
jgi:hypothetical protein